MSDNSNEDKNEFQENKYVPDYLYNFVRYNPTNLQMSLYESILPTPTRKFKKFIARTQTTTLNNAMDIGRMVVDGVAGPETPERKEKRQVQEDALNEFLVAMHGEGIIKRKKRYGLNSSVVEMETAAGEFTNDIVNLVVGFKGIDKALKGVKYFDKAEKATKSKKGLKKIFNRDVGRQVIAGETAVQTMFDIEGTPALINIAPIIGAVLPENDGMLEDIQEYLELPEGQSVQKDRLNDRMNMLAEGLLFTGGMIGAGHGLGILNRKFNLTGKAVDFASRFKKSFIENLDKLKNQPKEIQERFLNAIRSSSNENAAQLRVAKQNRKFEETKNRKNKEYKNEPVVTGEGDIEAFIPSKFSLFNISPQFAQNRLVRSLETIRKKMFTSRGARSNKLFERFLRAENRKEMHSDTVANIAFNLESTIDDIVKRTGKSSDDIKKQINYVLFTDFRSPTIITGGKISLGRTQSAQFKKELNKLPKELREYVLKAREYQDDLTKMLMGTNYISPEMKKIFADNLGFYVRRSYKAFEDGNYKPTNDVKKRAEEYIESQLKLQNPNITPDELLLETKAVMNSFEEIGKKETFTANLESFDRVRREILKNKKQIPKPIRELLGEIDDPTEAIIHSTTKLSKLLEDAKFYDGAFQDGIGIYIRRKQQGIFTEVIPEGFGPLSGKYTSPEMLSYFNGHKGLTQNLMNAKYLGGLYTNLMKLKGISQKAKTIWSHTTHVKNMTGGVQMSLANGINVFDVKQTREIIKILRSRTKNNKDAQKFHERLSELGLLNKGVVARDLQALAGDLATKPKGFILGNLDWAAEKIGLKKLSAKAQNAYIAEDDFFKINMFIREEQNLKKINDALPEALKKSPTQIEEEAARIVRNTLPNYDLVPEFFKEVRAVPFMGRFFSFMSESVRISYGSIMQARREFQEFSRLKSLGHNQAANEYLKRGGLRLGSFTAVAGTGAAAIEKTSQAMSGLSDAETEAYKDFLPDYMRNSKIAITVAEDGTPMIGNLSSWDAYDYPKKVVKLIGNEFFNNEINNEDFSTALLDNLFREAVSPFLGESMIQEPLSDFLFSNGKTKTGGNMSFNFMGDRYEYVDYGNPTTNKLYNSPILFGKLMTETLLPGSVDRFFDYTKTFGKDQTYYKQDIYELDQFMKFTTGWGMSPMNKEYLENIHQFKSNDYKKMKSQHANNINNGIGEVLEYEKFIDNYIDVNMLNYKNYVKYAKFNQSADFLGLNTAKLMYDSNISKTERAFIRQKRYNPLRISDNMKLKMMERDDNKVYRELMPDIYRIDRALSDLPVMYDENTYKIFKEDMSAFEMYTESVKEKTKKDIEEKRQQKKTGGRVLNVEEDPIDRQNPITGNTYFQDANRLGFATGGVNKILNDIFKSIKTTGLNPSEASKPTKQFTQYMGQYEYKPKVNFDEGGPVDSFGTTINDLLSNSKTQLEKQFNEKGEHTHNAMVNKNPDDFVRDMYLILKDSGHPFPKMAAAQAAVESRYGMSDLSREHNNTFGVKVRKGEDFKGTRMLTKEDYGKGLVDEVANFRSYNSVRENIDGYINFLKTGVYDDGTPRYKKALEASSDLEFLEELKKAGYATDQEYIRTVSAVYNRNLEKGTFD